MSFSNTELKVIKSLVDFAKDSKLETLLFAKKDATIFIKISATFESLKKLYANAKKVDTFDEDNAYPVMLYITDNKFTAQLNAEVVKDGDSRLCEVKVSTYKKLEEILAGVSKNKLFGSLTRLSLETMEQLVKNFKEEKKEEKKEEEDVKMPEFYSEEEEEEYSATGAQQEMQKIIEASLGNIALLLDSKMKKKMSFAALKAIITSVIKTTLKAAGVEDEKKEKEVLKLCEEQGLLPKKKEKGSGPTNAFIIFQQEKRVEMKEQFEGKDSKEISSELGKMWKTMTEEEQKSYRDKAAKKNAEKGVASNKGSKAASKKGSKKASSTKYTHKCTFVMTKGERANEQCGTTVKSEVPTHDGEWLCSKHVTAMKKRAETASKKSEKKKSEKPKKKKEEEDKPSKSKKVKKTEKKEEEEEVEEVKPKKKTKKEEDKPKKAKKEVKKQEDEEELEELEEEEESNNNGKDLLDSVYTEWEDGDGFVEGVMTKEVLTERFTAGKKVAENDEYEEEGYPVKISATKNALLVSWTDDDGDKRAKVAVENADDDILAIQKYIMDLSK
jgi:hypothetical protein